MPTPRTPRTRLTRGHIAGRTGTRTTPTSQDLPSPANTETPADAAPRPTITGRSGTSFWIRDVVVPLLIAVITGGIVAWGTIHAQKNIDDTRADRLLRAANLTFVRDKSSPDPDLPRPFNGIDLAGQNLRGLDLTNAEFNFADLPGASLFAANLSGASLSGANLRGADLQGANLSDADPSDAYSGGAIMRNADLRGSDLNGTNLNGADLRGADLDGADVSSADLNGANLTSANLSGADLDSADLDGADLSGVCWSASTSWGTFRPPPSDPLTCDTFDL